MVLFSPGETRNSRSGRGNRQDKTKRSGKSDIYKNVYEIPSEEQKKSFLLAESEEKLNTVENAMKYYDKGIFLTGHALIKEGENREEDVVNEINGTETDCILSVLTSPYQEKFIAENQALLNVKLWFGCGTLLEKSYGERKLSKKALPVSAEKAISSVSRETTEKIRLDKSGKNVHIWNL